MVPPTENIKKEILVVCVMCLLYLVTVYVIGSNKVYLNLNLNLRGEYSFDSGETESADEDMAAVGEPVGER